MDEFPIQVSQEQLRIHNLKVETRGLVYKDRSRIDSPFNPQTDKMALYFPHLADMKISHSGENDVIEVDTSLNHLIFYEMRQMLPALKVARAYAEEIEIAWSFDPASAFWSSTVMNLDGKTGPELPVAIHQHNEGTCCGRNLPGIREDAGNISELTDWHKSLPSHMVSCYPLWSWVLGGSTSSLPLTKKQSLSFIVNKRKISEFLMMRRFVKKDKQANGNPDEEEGEWKQIIFDPKYLGLEEVPKLSPISAKGYYGRSLPDEINIGIQQCLKCGIDGQIEYPFEDSTSDPSQIIKKLGEIAQYTPTSNVIGKKIIIVCKNKTAEKYGYQYNYSTHAANHREGLNPVSKIELFDLKSSKVVQSFDRRSIDSISSRLFPQNHNRGTEDRIPGFNAICFTLRPADIIDTNGVDLSLNHYRIDIYLEDNGVGVKTQSRKTEFQVMIYICSARRLIYKPSADGSLHGEVV